MIIMKTRFLTIALAVLAIFATDARAQRSNASIFRTWGFVGDSFCSGEMQCFDNDGKVVYADMYEYSWGQQLCRLCGSEGWNFSRGGQTARGWLEDLRGQRGWGYARVQPKQAYIIAMGCNDYRMREEPGYSLEEYRTAMETIISNLKEVQPKAHFFVLTRPMEPEREQGYDRWNDVVRSLPSKFSNVWVIDFYRDAPPYDKEFREQYFLNSHMSAAGYLWTAHFLMDSIDAIIRSHPDEFRESALIGTPYRGTEK